MTTFFYEGTDSDFKPCSGELDAGSIEDAREQLELRGVRIRSLTLKPMDDPLKGLNPSESVQVQEQVRELVGAGLPLAEGLRAAAAEFQEPGVLSTINGMFFARSSARIRRALIRTASAIEAGKPIDAILTGRDSRSEVGAILQSGISSEAAAMAVGEYSAYARSSMRLRSHVVFLFAYPVVIATLSGVLLAAFMVYLVPEMKKVFADFSMELPALTEIVIGISDQLVLLGPRTVLVAPLLIMTSIVVSVARGRWARRLLGWLPLIGSSFRSVDLSRMSHLLAVVLRHNASVPKALRAAGSAVEDKGIRNACSAVADLVDDGGEMPQTQAGLGGFPLGFVHVAQHAEDRTTVADALHSIADMFENRARIMMGLLVSVVQPLVVLLIVGSIALCLAALLLPVLRLLGGLI